MNWTPDKDEFIRDNLIDCTYKQLAEKLSEYVGRLVTTRQVKSRSSDLGFRKRDMYPWTPQLDRFLKDNYMSMSDTLLGKEIGRLNGKPAGHYSVQVRLKKLNLSRVKDKSDLWNIALKSNKKPARYEITRYML